jgi:nucleoside-diphosphate-sugar epimerase
MKYFITGITGFIGSNLARYLLAEGNQVNAIVRNLPKINTLSHPNQHLFVGDLHNSQVLLKAMRGCDQGFHLAAYAKPWSKDRYMFYKINIEGTINVFESAIKAGIKKIIFTSSSATMSPSKRNTPCDESTLRKEPYFNEYEITKSNAELLSAEYVKKGLPVVIVNPSRVYGPGPINESNSITKLIRGYCSGHWRIIPGNGEKIGNYVFIDDVVNGHVLAAQKGRAGERYILGGDNLSFDDLFTILKNITGISRKMVRMPFSVMCAVAKLMEWQYYLTRNPPAITVSWIKKYLRDWCLSSAKAERELGYTITSFDEGARKTIHWLTENSLLDLNNKVLR